MPRINHYAISAGLLFCIAALSTSLAMAGNVVSISGTVTEAGSGQPVAGATVAIGDRQGSPGDLMATVTTEADGSYSVDITFSASEQVIVVEAASPEHAPRRHGGTVEPGCFFNCLGNEGLIIVEPGDDLANVDFSLQPGGRIAGRVSRADDGQSLENAYIVPHTISSFPRPFSSHFSPLADSDGYYQSPLSLPVGDYHLIAYPGDGENFVAQAWQNYSCQLGGCPLLDTESISVEENAIVDDLDFALKQGAELAGSLQPEDMGRIIRLFDGSGHHLGEVEFLEGINTPGHAFSFTGLAGGSYYLELGPLPSIAPWVRVLHNGLICPWAGCLRATGEPLVVAAGTLLELDEVTLQSGGQISGEILDAVSGLPPVASGIGGIGMFDVVTADGIVVGAGSILASADGRVLMANSSALPDGDYFVRTHTEWLGYGIGFQGPFGGNVPGYGDAMYPDVACVGSRCDMSAATPVSVTDGEVTSIVIEVSTGSTITGTVVDDQSGEPLDLALVRLINENGEVLATGRSTADGGFSFGAFPEGSYFLRTTVSGSSGPGIFDVQNAYFDRLYGASDPCSEMLCDPQYGTALELDGSDIGSIELRVQPGPVIRGRIVSVPDGLQLNNGWVRVYRVNGNFVGRYRINPNTGRYQTTALAPGVYNIVPDVSPAYSAAPIVDAPVSTNRSQSPIHGLVVEMGTEDINADDLRVIDQGVDRIFLDAFSTP